MSNEFEAELNGQPVTVCYEVEGYKPLGLWVRNAGDRDITDWVSIDEYEALYAMACDRVASSISDKQEDRRDHELEDKAYWAELEATK